MYYFGRALDLDLSSGEQKMYDVPERIIKEYVGGKGLGARILYDELEPGVDPLSPLNVLIFVTGPLTSTIAPTSGRWAVVTKSPHTGVFLDSQVGGHFGAALRRAGVDVLIVRGKAESPVYIYVENGKAELRDAGHLWGKGIIGTEDELKRIHPGCKVGSIGPAGEHLVTFSMIGFDYFRQAGRGGAGAVMGSKNLKAVVVKPGGEVKYYDKSAMQSIVSRLLELIRENSVLKQRTEIGTPMWVKMANDGGFLPTRNFSKGVYECYEDVSGEAMKQRIWVKNKACYGCPIACGKLTRVREGKYKGNEVEGPEYETVALLGSNCEIRQIESVAFLNRVCDDLGLDTISAGGVLGFAMECYERGLLKDTDGLQLHFGNEEAAAKLLMKIAYQDGIGKIFSRGVRQAAREIGQGSDKFAIHVKGLELPGVEPRGSWGMALAFATADRGGCHQRAWTPTAELKGLLPRFSTEQVAKFIRETQNERSVCFSLVLCDFVPFTPADFSELLFDATGISLSMEEYMVTGERIWNLTRMFNVREGITRKDDTLPQRIMEEPSPEGPAKGKVISKEILDEMLDEYYGLSGWDKNGIPKDETLERLKLI